MDSLGLKPFPSHFVLRDIAMLTSPFFELKVNPFQEEAYDSAKEWFIGLQLYDESKQKKFLGHRFNRYSGITFPNADVEHLYTCIVSLLWGFSLDSFMDEGEFQSKPEMLRFGVNISMMVLDHPEAPPPNFKYAAMLHHLWDRIRATASRSCCNRFRNAVEDWMNAQLEQAENRACNALPSVDNFITFRRRTFGCFVFEAILEYSLDLDIPEHVWDDPVMIEISKATMDIYAWPNDLCSSNKEQADGDFQNLVFCVMLERDTDLQSAIDIVTDMISQRVTDFVALREKLPSFGADVDHQLRRYLKALEHFIQGTITWYFESSRYFRNMEAISKDGATMVVPVYPRLESATL